MYYPLLSLVLKLQCLQRILETVIYEYQTHLHNCMQILTTHLHTPPTRPPLPLQRLLVLTLCDTNSVHVMKRGRGDCHVMGGDCHMMRGGYCHM